MKVTKLLSIVVLMLCMIACGKPVGELVGTTSGAGFVESNPYGMVLVRKGAFLMGANSQSAIFSQSDNNVMVTVNAFWMDETEITNSEYRQFVNWVRDSIAYSLLIEEEGTDSEYALQPKYESDDETVLINWKKRIPWENRFIPDEPMAEILAPMFYDEGRGSLKTTALRYHYTWVNIDQAVKVANKFDVARGRYPKGASIRVDSFWVENDEIYYETSERPLRQPSDINTPSYSEYPVVGVTWEQAHAFCHWRTQLLRSQQSVVVNSYRLPTEAEWEYAARGGRKMAMYPWGDRYARDAEGCYLANFKPYRGSYHNDTGVSTMAVGQFEPNDFGLFDMAGNVAEWTASAYSTSSNTNIHDLNPEFPYIARKEDPNTLKRKVIKGGSWKDISYYLQCGVRSYEYQYEGRSYIGFRCVRSYMGQ